MSVPALTWKYLNDLWRLRDRRMDGYPLMDSPIETILLTSTYILIVKGKNFDTSISSFLVKPVEISHIS